MKHSRFSPSGSKRWINCPGSIALCDKIPKKDDSTSYSIEGTAAHALAELCLQRKVKAETCRADTIEGVVVSGDMIDAVQVYLDEVNSHVKKNCELWVEKKFDMSWLHKGMFGSNDACIYDKDKKIVKIFDYKHGAGIPVEVEWNSQLMIYALGALHFIWMDQVTKTTHTMPAITAVAEKIEIFIVQPRTREEEHIKKWTITTEEIMFWAINVLKPAAIETEKENAPFRVGSHCRFCKALAVCTEQKENALRVAKTSYDNITLPNPGTLTPEETVKVLQASEVISMWAKEVAAYAQGQMLNGNKLPGYKLVAKKANRKWLNDNEAIRTLSSHLGEDAYVKKVLSVAQAEKALKGQNLSHEVILDGLWEKPSGGLTMAPENDRRKEVHVNNVELDFLEHMDFLQ